MNEKLKRLLDIKHELDIRKELYKEFDKLVLELKEEGFQKEIIDDQVILLKDNFENTNTGWTRSAVKRWDVDILTKAQYEKKESKKHA